MEHYRDEVLELLLKYYGQVGIINHNNMNHKFYEELEKEKLDVDEFCDVHQELSEHFSTDYEEQKEETNSEFIKDTIAVMKRLTEIAANIKS
jgi:hypothetical protein